MIFFFIYFLPVARNRSVSDSLILALIALLSFVSLLWINGLTLPSK